MYSWDVILTPGIEATWKFEEHLGKAILEEASPYMTRHAEINQTCPTWCTEQARQPSEVLTKTNEDTHQVLLWCTGEGVAQNKNASKLRQT